MKEENKKKSKDREEQKDDTSYCGSVKAKYVPLLLRYYKNLKSVNSSQSYVFFIASKQQNIMITTEKN